MRPARGVVASATDATVRLVAILPRGFEVLVRLTSGLDPSSAARYFRGAVSATALQLDAALCATQGDVRTAHARLKSAGALEALQAIHDRASLADSHERTLLHSVLALAAQAQVAGALVEMAWRIRIGS